MTTKVRDTRVVKGSKLARLDPPPNIHLVLIVWVHVLRKSGVISSALSVQLVIVAQEAKLILVLALLERKHFKVTRVAEVAVLPQLDISQQAGFGTKANVLRANGLQLPRPHALGPVLIRNSMDKQPHQIVTHRKNSLLMRLQFAWMHPSATGVLLFQDPASISNLYLWERTKRAWVLQLTQTAPSTINAIILKGQLVKQRKPHQIGTAIALACQ